MNSSVRILADFTIHTVPERLRTLGDDAWSAIRDAAQSLDALGGLGLLL